MLRKTCVFVLVVLFVGASIVSGFNTNSINNLQPTTRGWLYVGGTGEGNYTKIQDAIDNATTGDTVFVYNGTYYECIIINKSISLIGEDKNNTIIDGGLNGDVVNISVDFVNISGFTIQNSGWGEWPWSTFHGMIIYSNYSTIYDNTIINNENGIGLSGYRNTISGNIIKNNSGFDGVGIWLFGGNNTIIDNIIISNEFGIFLYGSSDNKIKGNNISNNGNGILIRDLGNNTVYYNNFINNTINAQDSDINIWYNASLQEGNYWSDYIGEDNNGDGIGDIPYNISGGDNQDLYPLMHPFELYYVLDIITENNTINESTMFNVTIKSLGGTRIPDALVEFNDELKLTDSNGVVNFTTPQVENDTYYEIIATKEGYTGANKTILVKNVQNWVNNVIMIGLITNLTTAEENIEFNAKFVGIVQFSPFSVKIYNLGQKFTISKFYRGFVGYRFIFTACDLLI